MRHVVAQARIADVHGIVVRVRHQRALASDSRRAQTPGDKAGIGIGHSSIECLAKLQANRRIDLIQVVAIGRKVIALLQQAGINQPSPTGLHAEIPLLGQGRCGVALIDA